MKRSMKATCVAVSVLVCCAVVGCGETDCIEPGVYTCTYSLLSNDCPAGMVKQSWTVTLAVNTQTCGKTKETGKPSCEGDCCVGCDVQTTPPYEIGTWDGIATCGIACSTSSGTKSCGYAANLFCEK